MAPSSMGLKLGAFGCLPTIPTKKQNKTKQNKKHTKPQSLHTVRRFTQVLPWRSAHSRCKWHMHLRIRGYFESWNSKDPQFKPHVRIKMVQVLGSPLYICASTSFPMIMSYRPFSYCIDYRRSERVGPLYRSCRADQTDTMQEISFLILKSSYGC